jgi:hypothetical protein
MHVVARLDREHLVDRDVELRVRFSADDGAVGQKDGTVCPTGTGGPGEVAVVVSGGVVVVSGDAVVAVVSVVDGAFAPEAPVVVLCMLDLEPHPASTANTTRKPRGSVRPTLDSGCLVSRAIGSPFSRCSRDGSSLDSTSVQAGGPRAGNYAGGVSSPLIGFCRLPVRSRTSTGVR